MLGIAQTAATLIPRVGTLLEKAAADNVAPGIGVEPRTCVPSGRRSKTVNDRTSNTLTTSQHLRGLGINLREEPRRALACSSLRNPDLLAELDLSMDDRRWRPRCRRKRVCNELSATSRGNS